MIIPAAAIWACFFMAIVSFLIALAGSMGKFNWAVGVLMLISFVFAALGGYCMGLNDGC